MKKQNFLKVFILSAAMVAGLLLPTSMSAQKSDGFFRGNDTDNYDNRETFVINGNDSEGGLSNYGIGESVPLSSGLLIMCAAGTGYVLVRRRRSQSYRESHKHGIAVLLALSMVLVFTQCKKRVETIIPNNPQQVDITLDVSNGSRVDVDPYWTENPTYAKVTYEVGDVVHVAYNSEYVGKLTYQLDDETQKYVFKGSLSIEPVNDEPLYFFFLGNGNLNDVSNPDEKLVLIRDQTQNIPGKFPVISWARSTVNYTPSISVYKAKLMNVCSIVKFNITSDKVQEGDEIIITGVKEYVYVDFANHSFTFDY